jgi:hypothetical protein
VIGQALAWEAVIGQAQWVRKKRGSIRHSLASWNFFEYFSPLINCFAMGSLWRIKLH